jgi:putative phage-type endonuclease
VNPLQYTEEWWLARRGKLTASRMKTIVHGSPKGWQSLMNKLREESVAPTMIDEFVDRETPWPILHGREMEDVALANYELATGETVQLVGFKEHPKFDFIGCSSDFITEDGTGNGEIKCPVKYDNHREVFLSQQVPHIYQSQVQCQMACWELDYTVFVSYYEQAPTQDLGIIQIRVNRDDAYIRMMEEKCNRFWEQYTAGAFAEVVQSSGIPKFF